MERQLNIFFTFFLEIVGGLFAGSAFAITLVLGIAFFVGNVLFSPAISSSELETVFDYVVGPVGLVFGLLGVGFGIHRARLKLAVKARGSAPLGRMNEGQDTLSSVALAIVATVVAGSLAWPWLLITTTNRGIDTPTLVGAIAIPLVVGVVAFVVWQSFKRRRPVASSTGIQKQLQGTPPGLVGVAIASSLLIGAGTLAAVSNWHQIFLVLVGVPLTIALFLAHLFSCLFFFRPLPRPLPERPAGRPTERIEWPNT